MVLVDNEFSKLFQKYKENIRSYFHTPNNTTAIFYSDENYDFVKETPEEIDELIYANQQL